MKLANWKRMVLGALVALSVAGASLAPVMAGHAAAWHDGNCFRKYGVWWCEIN